MNANQIMDFVLASAVQRYGVLGAKLHAAHVRGKLAVCLGGAKDMASALRLADCYVGACPFPGSGVAA